jgi:hypothetical protein
MPKEFKIKPNKKDKKLIKEFRGLKGKQRRIIKGLLKNSDDWSEIRTLLRNSEVGTEKRHKSINKFDPHLEPLENYQLIVNHVTAHIRYEATLGDTR